MLSRSVKSFACGLLVAGAALASMPAQALPLPGLPNLNFLDYTGSAPKDYFTNVKPTGWTGGSGLIFIDQPGNSSNPNSACGSIYLTTYGCPSTLNIKGGYNYVEADGNPAFESGFNFLITGLTAGEHYQLSFYQAASQQTGFANGQSTTERWIVSLGLEGLLLGCCGPDDPEYGSTDYYYNNDPNASIVATNLMTTPSGGLTDWQYVTVDLVADSDTNLLSFLAWADNGSTVNLPPIVFLTGVDAPPGLTNAPEPATLSLMGAGVAGIYLRRRAKRKAAAE